MESQQEETKATIPPQKVEYCQFCTFPLEFCEYAKPQCQRVLAEKKDQSATDGQNKVNTQQTSYPTQQVKGMSISEETKANTNVQQTKEKSKQQNKKITVKLINRNRKKYHTQIIGLADYNISLKELSKKLKSKFSCGCSVVTGEGNQGEIIALQGDFLQEIVEELKNEYKIPEGQIVTQTDKPEK